MSIVTIFIINGIAGFLPGMFTVLGERAAGSAALAKVLLPIGLIALIAMCVLVIVFSYHWWYILLLIAEWILAAQVAGAIFGRR